MKGNRIAINLNYIFNFYYANLTNTAPNILEKAPPMNPSHVFLGESSIN
jgi:hypothetical protein